MPESESYTEMVVYVLQCSEVEKLTQVMCTIYAGFCASKIIKIS